MDQAALDALVYYLHERERVRLSKDAGNPRPWTSDPILRQFKFTNVLRENDHTTQWLINNWYRPNADEDPRLLLLNAAIARYFGTWEFCEAIGFQRSFQPTTLKQIASSRMLGKPKRPVFTSAYVITNGGISAPKEQVVVDYYLTPFWKAIEELVVLEGSFQRIAERMMRIPGFGGTGFMTKETVSDFILATRHRINWSDLYTWSPVGPGARRGLARLYGEGADAKMNDKTALTRLRAVAEAVAPRLEPWMPQFGDKLDLHGIQFAMCEIDKYLRTKNGEGTPKNTYKPRTS